MHSSLITLDQNTYQQVLDNLHEGLYFTDVNRVITYWNKAAEKITGFSADEVVGRACADSILTHVDCEGRNLCTGNCPLAQTIADGQARETDAFLHHKDGHRVEVSLRLSPLLDEAGEIGGGIELFSDLSQKEAQQQRIEALDSLAYLDSQTLLVNQSYVSRQLSQRLEEYHCFKIPFAVLLMDIDQLKWVNEQYGHQVGDDVLSFVANTFNANSGPFDLYGRWGGAEFVGIIRNITRAELELLAERLRMLVENAYIIRGGKRVSVTISMGAAMVNRTDTLETLLSRAEQLKEQSKCAGRNRVTFG